MKQEIALIIRRDVQVPRKVDREALAMRRAQEAQPPVGHCPVMSLSGRSRYSSAFSLKARPSMNANGKDAAIQAANNFKTTTGVMLSPSMLRHPAIPRGRDAGQAAFGWYGSICSSMAICSSVNSASSGCRQPVRRRMWIRSGRAGVRFPLMICEA